MQCGEVADDCSAFCSVGVAGVIHRGSRAGLAGPPEEHVQPLFSPYSPPYSFQLEQRGRVARVATERSDPPTDDAGQTRSDPVAADRRRLVAAAAFFCEQCLSAVSLLRAQRDQGIVIGPQDDATVMALEEIADSAPDRDRLEINDMALPHMCPKQRAGLERSDQQIAAPLRKQIALDSQQV